MSVIRLDLNALQESGQLSRQEAVRLTALALPQRGNTLAINVLLIFGAVAIATASIALVPNAGTGLALALIALASAEVLRRFIKDETFGVLATALALMGTLGLAGWIGWEFRDVEDATAPALLITGVLGAGAIWFRSAFLAALATLSLGAVFGTGTAYWHASYALFVEEASITIAVFGALAATFYKLRGALKDPWSDMLTVCARTALLLVHFAFWVGSLFGDTIGDAWTVYSPASEGAAHIPDYVFALAWAAFSLTLALRAARGGYVSISALIFLIIHGYTQYFETFGAEPESLLFAGIILVALAVGLSALLRRNRKLDSQAPDGLPPGGDNS